MTEATRPGSRLVESIFDAVIDLPSEEAARILDRDCADKPEVRAAVERLIARDREVPAAFLSPNGTLVVAERRALEETLAPIVEEEPARIGRFRVMRKLGGGGMGVVLVAYDEQLDRRVAIKILRREIESQAWLRREAVALARLSHPNVVHVHEVGEHDGRGYVAMELVKGMTLREWLVDEPRSSAEIIGAFVQAGQGLAAAHGAGLVHCDFKPDNVLVGDDGRARVVDFGIASLAAKSGDDDAIASSPSASSPRGVLDTRSGLFLGTPAYMSPEQFLAERVTAASDQWSFCVSLYRALYGAPPFDGDDVPTLREHVVAGALRSPPSTRDVPGWIAPILLRGLARHAAARFDSMTALLAAIAEHVPRDPDLDRGVGARERGLVFGSLALTGAGLVTAMVVRGPDRVIASARDLVVVAIGLVGIGGTAMLALRKRLLANAYARRMAALIMLLLVSFLAHRAMGAQFDLPVDRILPGDLLIAGAELAVGAIALDRRLAWLAGVFLSGAAVATLVPNSAIAAMGASALTSAALGTMLWRDDR